MIDFYSFPLDDLLASEVEFSRRITWPAIKIRRSGDYKRFKQYLKDAQNQDEKLQKKISLLQSSMFRGLKQADMFKQYFTALEEADRLWKRRKDDVDAVCELKRILPQVIEVFPIYKEYYFLHDIIMSLSNIFDSFQTLAASCQDEFLRRLCESSISDNLNDIDKILRGDTNLQYLHCPALERLISLYESEHDYEQTIELCDLGLRRGDRCDFAGGFQAKKERIFKKSKTSS